MSTSAISIPRTDKSRSAKTGSTGPDHQKSGPHQIVAIRGTARTIRWESVSTTKPSRAITCTPVTRQNREAAVEGASAGYDLPLPDVIGRLNISVLQRFDSGVAWSEAFAINTRTFPGAPTGLNYVAGVPATDTYFLCRGCQRMEDETATDVALNYARRLWRLELSGPSPEPARPSIHSPPSRWRERITTSPRTSGG